MQFLWWRCCSPPSYIRWCCISSAIKLSHIDAFRPYLVRLKHPEFVTWNSDLKLCIAMMLGIQSLITKNINIVVWQMFFQLITNGTTIKSGHKHVNSRSPWGCLQSRPGYSTSVSNNSWPCTHRYCLTSRSCLHPRVWCHRKHLLFIRCHIVRMWSRLQWWNV